MIIAEVDSLNLGDQAIFYGLRSLLYARGFSVQAFGLESATLYEINDRSWYLDASSAVRAILPKSPLRRVIAKRLPASLLRVVRLLYLPFWFMRYRRRVQTVFAKFLEADVVVFGGGGLLINNNWHFPLAIRYLTQLLKARGKRYGFSGIGGFANLDQLTHRLFETSLREAAFVHVRDTQTQNALSNFLPITKPRIGPDYALFCVSMPSFTTLRRNQSLHYAINIMAPSSVHYDRKQYQNALNGLREFIISHASSKRFTIFTTGWSDDDIAAKHFVKSLPSHIPSPAICTSFDNVGSLLNFLNETDIVIAMRLHAAILCVSSGVPLVALGCDNKVAAFLDQVGLTERLLDPLSFSIHRLDDAILRAMGDDGFAITDKIASLRALVNPLLDEIVSTTDTSGRQ
jgi:polysaccharide pyruvyl transferase WcaK-like protein